MAHSSLATTYIGENPNYSNPSYRVGPNLIVVHHMAGVLTPQQCNNALKNGKASIHYAIGNDGTIGWGIDENEVAWHAGNWPINQRSIGIETSNSSTGGDWPVSEAAFNSLVNLVAEIAKRRGFGKLVSGKNIGYHQMYCSTTCPGPTLKARFQELIDKANDINSGDKKPTLTWTKLKSQERWSAALQPTHLWNFNHTDVNKCESIKEYDKGTEFTIYGKVYNDQLASMYLLTEYSFTNKIPNGFNECDMNRKPDLTWTKLDAPVTYLTALDTTHLWDFDYTNVNDCKSVKDYKKGEEVTIYGTCYNAQLASVYLLNEQDFNNKVTHGFNECDMEKKPEPTPPTPGPDPDPTVGILQKIIQFIQHIIDLITGKDK